MQKENYTSIDKNQVSQFYQKLKQAKNILLVTHRNPDADAIGSLSVMIYLVRVLKREATAFCFDSLSKSLEYLKYSSHIINDKGILGKNYDLVVIMDCGDLKYSGIQDELFFLSHSGVEIVNIDHHQFNQAGDVNIVDSSAPSTTLILYDVLNWLRLDISSDIATSLLAGLLADTSNFANSSTNIGAIEAAESLLKKGANLNKLNKYFYQVENSNEWLTIWSKVLSRVKKNDKLNIVYSVILYDELVHIKSNVLEGVSNFFNYMQDADVVMVIKEIRLGEIKFSLRSPTGRVDVSKLAKFFGGGGHKKAAGFLVYGSLEKEGEGWKII